MENIKNSLIQLNKAVKSLQELNTATELQLDKLESDIDDMVDNGYDMALNAIIKELSEEELDEIFNEHNRELFTHDPAQLDLFGDTIEDAGKIDFKVDKFGRFAKVKKKILENNNK